MSLEHSSSGWFEASACTAAPEDLPPSLMQHGSSVAKSFQPPRAFVAHGHRRNHALARRPLNLKFAASTPAPTISVVLNPDPPVPGFWLVDRASIAANSPLRWMRSSSPSGTRRIASVGPRFISAASCLDSSAFSASVRFSTFCWYPSARLGCSCMDGSGSVASSSAIICLSCSNSN